MKCNKSQKYIICTIIMHNNIAKKRPVFIILFLASLVLGIIKYYILSYIYNAFWCLFFLRYLILKKKLGKQPDNFYLVFSQWRLPVS